MVTGLRSPFRWVRHTAVVVGERQLGSLGHDHGGGRQDRVGVQAFDYARTVGAPSPRSARISSAISLAKCTSASTMSSSATV